MSVSLLQIPQLRELEEKYARILGPGVLMERAGKAAADFISDLYPAPARVTVVCGPGNNGGDGYVVARLAQAAGRRVTLLAVESDSPLPEEAQAAREAWLNAGGVIHAATIPWPDDISLIIDGLLGTGLRSAPRDPVAALIHQANHHPAPVVALDIPSGLNTCLNIINHIHSDI